MSLNPNLPEPEHDPEPEPEHEFVPEPEPEIQMESDPVSPDTNNDNIFTNLSDNDIISLYVRRCIFD